MRGHQFCRRSLCTADSRELLAGLDSTECLVDGTHMDGTVIDNALGGGAALVSYMSAMRTFAQCVDANIEVPGIPVPVPMVI